MNIKIIGAIMCVVITLFCSIPAFAEDEIAIDRNQIIDAINMINKIVDNRSNTNDEHYVEVFGPVSRLFKDVKLEGKFSIAKLLVSRNVNRRLLRFSMFLPFIPIWVEGINFTVTFKKDVDNDSRFIYCTFHGDPIYDEEGNLISFENESEIRNLNHTVEVKNFTGIFAFRRARIRKMPLIKPLLPDEHRWFIPARFGFAGFYDEISVSTE